MNIVESNLRQSAYRTADEKAIRDAGIQRFRHAHQPGFRVMHKRLVDKIATFVDELFAAKIARE